MNRHNIITIGRWFCVAPIAADPVPWGLRVNRVGGRLIGFAVGFGRSRYLSLGRFR